MATAGSGRGLIAPGGDRHAYLGHFRSEENVKRGHNIGDPRGDQRGKSPRAGATVADAQNALKTGGKQSLRGASPTFNPTTNPIAAARQSNQANRAAAKLAGEGMGAARVENQASLRAAKSQRKARNVAGLHKSDVAAETAAKVAARTANAPVAPTNPKLAAIGAAKTGLQSAVGNVRTSRQAIRAAIRGGNAAGAGAAFGGLQEAKAARKTARQGVRTARKGKIVGATTSTSA